MSDLENASSKEQCTVYIASFSCLSYLEDGVQDADVVLLCTGELLDDELASGQLDLLHRRRLLLLLVGRAGRLVRRLL